MKFTLPNPFILSLGVVILGHLSYRIYDYRMTLKNPERKNTPIEFNIGLRLPLIYKKVEPLLSRFSLETLQEKFIKACSHQFTRNLFGFKYTAPYEENVRSDFLGITLNTPVGVAAGIDNTGGAVEGLFDLGFGSVEVGTVTNFRHDSYSNHVFDLLPEDQAIIHRTDFRNPGSLYVSKNLEMNYYSSLESRGLVGCNINYASTTPVEFQDSDIEESMKKTAPYTHYFVVNAPPMYEPANRKEKDELKQSFRLFVKDMVNIRNKVPVNLEAHPVANNEVKRRKDIYLNNKNEYNLHQLRNLGRPPLFFKLSADCSESLHDLMASVCVEEGVQGLVISGGSYSREAPLVSPLSSPLASQPGEISGAPIKHSSTQAIARMYSLTNGQIPIIGAGGVSTARDALEKIKAGASVVQLASALRYEGPGVGVAVTNGLSELLREEGFNSVKDAIGVEANQLSKLK